MTGRRDRSVRRAGTDAPSRRPLAALVTIVLATLGLVVSVLASFPALRLHGGPEPVSRVAAPDTDLAGPRAGRPRVDSARERTPERPRAVARTQDRTAAVRATRTAARTVSRPAARTAARPAPRPVSVSVPAVGLDLPVVPVGVRDDGQMRIPDDPALLGWYRFGPTPGGSGSAVVAGHLDSWEYGVGPLVRLRDVRVGDAVVVRTAEERVVLTVTGVRRYAKEALPPTLFARTGEPRLRLVTCGGAFDEAAGSYEENLVVTAEPAG